VAFDDLPTAPIYTMVVDAPISWVVRPREALHDLDNLQLSHLHHDENIEAVYDLDYIVVEGHARESHNNAAPRGLQLQLTAQDGSTMDDTQVVATLGYLQFKAKPGVFRLEIREGQGRDIYRTDSVGTEGWNSPNVTATGNEIAVTSFEGSTLYPRFGRRPGAEHRDVLVQEEPETEEQKPAQGVIENVMSKSVYDRTGSRLTTDQRLFRVTSLFKSAPEKDVPTTDVAVAQNVTQQADINIFTVASGLLYEVCSYE
jgi:UDP-glucose:glycoprotein glucosyltransferase